MSRTRTRQRRPVILLRPVPRETSLHRVWAGTKVLSAAALSVAVSFAPSWTGLGILLAVLVVGVLVARIPRALRGSRPGTAVAIRRRQEG